MQDVDNSACKALYALLGCPYMTQPLKKRETATAQIRIYKSSLKGLQHISLETGKPIARVVSDLLDTFSSLKK